MADKEIIATDAAPAAIGPYSQAVRAGGFVFLSGQIPLDPATGEMITGDIEGQTRQVMKNLEAVLTAAGTSFDKVVRATIYLTDLGDFAKVNAAYEEHFDKDPPARSTVAVSALPMNAMVEIEVIAMRRPGSG